MVKVIDMGMKYVKGVVNFFFVKYFVFIGFYVIGIVYGKGCGWVV